MKNDLFLAWVCLCMLSLPRTICHGQNNPVATGLLAYPIQQPSFDHLNQRVPNQDPNIAPDGTPPQPTNWLPTAFVNHAFLLPTSRDFGKRSNTLESFFEALALAGRAPCLSEGQVFAIVPALNPARGSAVWISKDTWLLPSGTAEGRRDVCVGATFIRADMGKIRRADRNYARQTIVGREKGKLHFVYAVDGSYFRNDDPRNPFVVIRIFGRNKEHGCGQLPAELQVYEHRDQYGRLVVEYYAVKVDKYYWFRGRDTYYAVCGQRGEIIGYLLVTEFGYDVNGCADGVRHVRDDMEKALQFMKTDSEK